MFSVLNCDNSNLQMKDIEALRIYSIPRIANNFAKLLRFSKIKSTKWIGAFVIHCSVALQLKRFKLFAFVVYNFYFLRSVLQ